jgi:prepilin-type N-terminal cleavage/methylation domain-containing protein
MKAKMMMDRKTAIRRKLLKNNRATPSPDGGFTLLEVLIAAVVLAAGAAVVLGHVQQLLDYTRRARGHQETVRTTLNDIAELGLHNPATLARTLQGDHLILADDTGRPWARVENHPFQGSQVPLSQGFAPYQSFTLPLEGNRALTVMGLGLPKERQR